MQARRRTQGLLIEELADETVVYDTTRHKVHCLNRAATLVWDHCDGRTSPEEMAEILRKELSLPADEALARLILEELGELHLLEERSPKQASAARRTRRQVAKQLALLGVTGIVTIAAPTVALAASGCTSNSCSPPTICCQIGVNAGKCVKMNECS